jgi:hypothetical protein
VIPREQPRLEVELQADNVKLAWNRIFTGLELEQATNLAAPDWRVVTGAVSLAGEHFVVTNRATHPSVFYRLKSE